MEGVRFAVARAHAVEKGAGVEYKVSYKDSMVFIEENVLPYVKVLPIGLEDYLKAKNNIFRYSLKPSDAIHLGVIENNGLQAIATEDEDFDRVPIKRVWF